METEILSGDIATVRNQLKLLIKGSVKEVISLTQSIYGAPNSYDAKLLITIVYIPYP